jgi:hypothetical protein
MSYGRKQKQTRRARRTYAENPKPINAFAASCSALLRAAAFALLFGWIGA